MKRVIVAVIAGLCLCHTGYAQSSSLEWQFDLHAKRNAFTYVYMGNGYSELKVSEEVTKEFSKVKFVKILKSEQPNSKEVKNAIKNVRFFAGADEFVLALKIAEQGEDKTEIYLRRSGKNELEKVIIRENSKEVSVTWIYGEEKQEK